MSGDDKLDLGFFNSGDAYFVIETPDGESLHVALAGCGLSRSNSPPPGAPRLKEPGVDVRFRCIGDDRGRGYFFARSVVEKSGRLREHAWVVEYTSRDGITRQSRFRGTLRNYREQERPRNEWRFFGTIRIALPH